MSGVLFLKVLATIVNSNVFPQIARCFEVLWAKPFVDVIRSCLSLSLELSKVGSKPSIKAFGLIFLPVGVRGCSFVLGWECVSHLSLSGYRRWVHLGWLLVCGVCLAVKAVAPRCVAVGYFCAGENWAGNECELIGYSIDALPIIS